MACPKVAEIPHFCEDQLTEEMETQWDEHFKLCPECVAAYDKYKAEHPLSPKLKEVESLVRWFYVDKKASEMRALIAAGSHLPWRSASDNDLEWLGIKVLGLDPSYDLLRKVELPEGWRVLTEPMHGFLVVDQSQRLRLYAYCCTDGDQIVVRSRLLPRFRVTCDAEVDSVYGVVIDNSRIKTFLRSDGSVLSHSGVEIVRTILGLQYTDENGVEIMTRAGDIAEEYMVQLGFEDWRNPRAYWNSSI